MKENLGKWFMTNAKALLIAKYFDADLQVVKDERNRKGCYKQQFEETESNTYKRGRRGISMQPNIFVIKRPM